MYFDEQIQEQQKIQEDKEVHCATNDMVIKDMNTKIKTGKRQWKKKSYCTDTSKVV